MANNAYEQLTEAAQKYGEAFSRSNYRAVPLEIERRQISNPISMLFYELFSSTEEKESRKKQEAQYFNDFRTYADKIAAGDTDAKKPAAPNFLKNFSKIAEYEASALSEGVARAELAKTVNAVFGAHPELVEAATGENRTPERLVQWTIQKAESATARSMPMPGGAGAPTMIISTPSSYEQIFNQKALGALGVVDLATATAKSPPTAAKLPNAAQEAALFHAEPAAVAAVANPASDPQDAANMASSAEAAVAGVVNVAVDRVAAPKIEQAKRHFTIKLNRGDSLSGAIVRDQKELMNEVRNRLQSGANNSDAALVAGLIIASAAGIKDANKVKEGTYEVDVTDQQIQSAIDKVTSILKAKGDSHAASLYTNVPLVPQKIVGDLRGL